MMTHYSNVDSTTSPPHPSGSDLYHSTYLQSATPPQAFVRGALLASFVACSTLASSPTPAAVLETATAHILRIDPQSTNRPKESLKLSLLKRIRDFRLYETNWDGMGAEVPSTQAVDDAESFLHTLPVDDIERPHIALSADGEINFYWETARGKLDLGIFGDGTYSYFGEAADGERFFCDDEPVETPLSRAILHLIGRVWKNEVQA